MNITVKNNKKDLEGMVYVATNGNSYALNDESIGLVFDKCIDSLITLRSCQSGYICAGIIKSISSANYNFIEIDSA